MKTSLALHDNSALVIFLIKFPKTEFSTPVQSGTEQICPE